MNELRDVIRADMARWREIHHSNAHVAHPGGIAVILFRVCHHLYHRGPVGRALAQLLWAISTVLTGSDLHSAAEIGPGLYIPHSLEVGFGEHLRAGSNLTLYRGVIIGQGPHGGSPTLGDDVIFWTRSCAFGAVWVGDRAQIGANVMLFKDVPADYVATNAPALIRPPRADAAVATVAGHSHAI